MARKLYGKKKKKTEKRSIKRGCKPEFPVVTLVEGDDITKMLKMVSLISISSKVENNIPCVTLTLTIFDTALILLNK
jgi:hypothetical protein